METKVLNYRIIIEPDVYTGSKKACYLAFCPTLDVADNGDSIEEALSHVHEAIRCRIDALIADGKPVPAPDNISKTIVVSFSSVDVPKNYPLAFS